MYLRRIARKNKDGTITAYIQLAHNEWDPQARCAKAKVCYSFGREDVLDREALRRLADSICRYLAANRDHSTPGGIQDAGMEDELPRKGRRTSP